MANAFKKPSPFVFFSLPKSYLMAQRSAPSTSSSSLPPATMRATSTTPFLEFLKSFQALMSLKDALARLDDPSSSEFRLASYDFMTALVSPFSLF